MRSLPIFRAWVRTCRYRLSLAATPTVTPSGTAVTRSACGGVCNTTQGLCQSASLLAKDSHKVPSEVGVCASFRLSASGCTKYVKARSPSVTSPQPRVAGDVDLLELERLVGTRGLDHPPGRRAEMAASRVVEDDARY